MPEILRPTNFDAINILEKTELSANVAAGQKIAALLSAQGFDTNSHYILGRLAGEYAELARVDSISGKNLTAAVNYSNEHKEGDEVTRLFGNKIRIYRAANVDGSVPADNSFSYIGVVDIDPDQTYSEFIDNTGGSGYWYKKTYYDSVTGSETSLDEAPAVRGGNLGTYANWEEVRAEAGLENNRWIPEAIYQEKLTLAQGEVDASLTIGGYDLPLTRVPAMVKSATLLLAAGYVLLKDYGPENTGTNKEGNQKLEQGRALLMKIEAGKLVLTDDQGNTVTGSSGIAGYPDSSAESRSPSEGPIFRITDKF